jgi:hypothetical protein
MPRDAKRSSEADIRASSITSLLFGWTQQGIDSFLATQRILADFVTRKSASAMKSLREGMSDPEHSPAAILTEIAVEGTANLTEAQRILLNLAEQENGIVMDGVMQRLGGSATAAAMASRVRRGIDEMIEMQQELLTIASKQVQERLEKTKAGKMPDPACLLDGARDAMEHFVKTQKKLLDIIVEEPPKHKGGKEEEKEKATLSALAREAASSLIDAQKNLLDLAGQQVNVNLQAASQMAEMVNLARLTPLPTITGEGVKSFVEAEKAVLDTIIRPANGRKSAHKAKRAKRPVRRRPAAQAEEAGA